MKQHLNTEAAKLKEMSFAEKRWYIWEYYKLHIIGFALVAFFIGSFIHARLNPGPDQYLYVVWMGIPALQEQLDGIADGLSVIVDDPEGEIVLVMDYTQTDNLDLNHNLVVRFMTFLHIGMLDTIITTRIGVEEVAELEFIRPLDDLLEYLYRYNPPLYQSATERMCENRMGISLAGSRVLEDNGINSEEAYITLVGNAVQVPRIAEALEVFLYG